MTKNKVINYHPFRAKINFYDFWYEPILVAFQIAIAMCGCIIGHIPFIVGGPIIVFVVAVYLALLVKRYNKNVVFEEQFTRAFISRSEQK
jgi:uncharacterized membrane protein